MATPALVRTDKGLESRFGKDHVRQFTRTQCKYCEREGSGENCAGCGAPLPAPNANLQVADAKRNVSLADFVDEFEAGGYRLPLYNGR